MMKHWSETFLQLDEPGLRVTRHADLTVRTSMRMAARAALLAEPQTPEALRRVVLHARDVGVPMFLLGGGKNTLFATSNFDGLVVTLGRGFNRLDNIGGNCIRVGASAQLSQLIPFTHRNGLMGLEFLTRVPGTVGGALAGNAGAGNWGICDFVERVYLMTRTGFVACVGRNQFRYGYRHCELRDAIVLMADLRLEPLDRAEATRRVEDFKAKKTNQPYHIPSSGCIFKNPKGPDGAAISAGKLIDECGLKGYAIRSARVSEGHANFIVNTGNSSGEDFLALISLIRDIVQARTGIELKMEVQIVGGPLSSAVLA